ncbi:DUF7230 family protein [Phytohalomonas tamaricis]|uniref:DUF7230 family protein n=1 Tax=Phytohalomonas tamaricis TaxID=2081032 RepID=UPI0021D4604A|nr:hypothetical protein [Phytohalomonas tamaricis]
MKARNVVHKNAMHYQKSHVFKDRKKLTRNGYRKHKKAYEGELKGSPSSFLHAA